MTSQQKWGSRPKRKGLASSEWWEQIPPAQNSAPSKDPTIVCVCVCVYVCVCVCVVAQSCLTPCDPTDCNPLDFSVPVMFQARIPEWIAFATPGHLTQGLNPSFLHHLLWQADSVPLSHLGSPFNPECKVKIFCEKKRKFITSRASWKKSFMKTALQAGSKRPPVDMQKYNGNQGMEPLAGRWKA